MTDEPIIVEEEEDKKDKEDKEEKKDNTIEVPNSTALSVATVNDLPVVGGGFKLDQTKPFKEQVKDVAEGLTYKKALEDEGTVEELADYRKEELKSSAIADATQEKKKVESATADLQRAIHDKYESIASYAGIRKALPKKMQLIVMAFLQVIAGLFIVVFAIPVVVINVVLDMVNSVAERFATLTVHAKRISIGLGILVIVGLVVWVVFFNLKRYNII